MVFKAETARQAVACRGFPTQETPVLDKKTVFAIFQTSPSNVTTVHVSDLLARKSLEELVFESNFII